MTTLNAAVDSPTSSDTNQSRDNRPGEDQAGGEAQSARGPINVPPGERWASGLAGGAMVLLGLRMRSLPGAIVALAGGAMVHRGWTGSCKAYEAMGINRSRGAGAQPEEYFKQGIHVSEAITIQKTSQELYDFWHDFENLPKFMYYLEDVKKIDEKRSHWKAKAPAGLTVEWDAEIINDEPGGMIAWRSLYPASVDSAGSVRFVEGPAGRGTEVRVVFDYIPPAGTAGWVVAKIFGRDPAAEVREDLRRFKELMETGVIADNKGQPHGARGLKGSLMATD